MSESLRIESVGNSAVKGRPRRIDWESAKSLYVSGYTAVETAKQVGASLSATRKKALAEEWSKDRILAKSGHMLLTPENLQKWLPERAAKFIQACSDLLERAQNALKCEKAPKGRDQIRQEISMLKEIVPTGRALYGLDRDQPEQRQQLAIIVRGNIELAQSCTLATSMAPTEQSTVDVESVSSLNLVTGNHEDVVSGEPEKQIP
jgi:hypothetical protein